MIRTKHQIGDTYKTNLDGDAILLEKRGKVAKIRFVNTGYEREVNIDNLVAGKARDYTIVDRSRIQTEYPNTLMQSNSYGDFILLEKKGNQCVIQFVDTGYTTNALWGNLKNGKIRDPYKKSNYGVGYIGEYKITYYTEQAKQLWKNMLKRCYSPKDDRGYFGRVTVDDRWLCFANFLIDLPNLENFDLWLNGYKAGNTKYNLDKDFKITGNKVYSREACMFLDESFNKSYTSRNLKVGND